MAKAQAALVTGAWAYRPLWGDLFGRICDADGDGGFCVVLHDRHGVAQTHIDPIEVRREKRHDWCRIRKPVFPVPAACVNVGDWFVRDFDFGIGEQELDALFSVERFVDLDAFCAFYESRGIDGGVSVALREHAQELRQRLPHLVGRLGSGYLPHTALPLADYLYATVRPRGCAGRLRLAEYTLSEAMEDWALNHEFALEMVAAEQRLHTQESNSTGGRERG